MHSKQSAKIPVLLLTGFLGSGKTTLLNKMLADGVKTAVVINEFGAAAIDQDLLQSQDMPLTVLSGGCLCCQVKGALAPTLKNLWMSWHDARLKPFDRIIIEASGVASPEPILDTLLREPWLSKRYHLKQVISILAIPAAAEQLQRFPETRAQLAWADLLVFSHADLANTEQIATLRQQAQSLAPTAPQLLVNLADFDPRSLTALASPVVRRLPSGTDVMTHRFHSVSLYLAQTPAWPELQLILQELLDQHADNLLRIKGVIYPSEAPQPLAIQAGNGRLYPPAPLQDRASADRRSRLVFICTGDDEAWLEQLQRQLGEAIDSRAIRRH